MNSRFFRLFLFLLIGLVGWVVWMKEHAPASRWLSRAQEQALIASVPPAPAPDSEVDRADLAEILAAQKARTPEIIAECKRDESFSYRLLENVYGPEWTADRAPQFHALMKEVMGITYVVNGTAKNTYRRLRPYEGHPDSVQALFPVNGFSYPSGHSMGMYTLAVVLGAVFPDKQQALLDRAAQIAESRVNAGVHYPSDIKEGEVLGKATGAAILASPAFQAELVLVKKEVGAEQGKALPN